MPDTEENVWGHFLLSNFWSHEEIGCSLQKTLMSLCQWVLLCFLVNFSLNKKLFHVIFERLNVLFWGHLVNFPRFNFTGSQVFFEFSEVGWLLGESMDGSSIFSQISEALASLACLWLSDQGRNAGGGGWRDGCPSGWTDTRLGDTTKEISEQNLVWGPEGKGSSTDSPCAVKGGGPLVGPPQEEAPAYHPLPLGMSGWTWPVQSFHIRRHFRPNWGLPDPPLGRGIASSA